MKVLAITSRVDYIDGYNEYRDSLDQRISKIAVDMGYSPIIIPNINSNSVKEYFNSLNIDAILLTGGNTISYFNDDSPNISIERDQIEITLIEFAISNNIPLFGICRGMQIVNYYFGGSAIKIGNHVAVRHSLVVSKKYIKIIPSVVNSYHSWGINEEELGEGLRPIAWDRDKRVEAFIHKSLPIGCLMWHPERDSDNSSELQLIKEILSG